MKNKIIYALCLLLLAFVTNAQQSGDYRSIATPVDLNLVANWQTFSGGTWVTSTLAPNGNVISGNTITIQTGHIWGNTQDVTIPTGATLVFQGANATSTFTVGKTITVNGTLENRNTVANSISTAGNIIFNSGSTYLHNTNLLEMPITNTTYSAGSTINVIGCTTNLCRIPTSCGNVIFNTALTTAAYQFVSGTPTTINGNLTIISTGTGTIHLGGSTTSRVANLLGNLIVNGGNLALNNAPSNTNSSQTMNITGNVNIAGGSISVSNSIGTGTNGVGNLFINGNLSHTAGTLGCNGGVTAGTLIFNGASTQSFATTGFSNILKVTIGTTTPSTSPIVTLTTDFTVNTGSTLLLTDGSLVLSAAKKLTIIGTANFNGKSVTLKSDATGSASISANTTISNATNVTVERYISFQRGYRAFGHPFTTAQSLTALNTAFAITGTGSGFNSSAAASAYSYNPLAVAGSAYTALSNVDIATTNWGVNQGILAMVRGNGTQGINFDYTGGTTATTISTTGTINQGTLSAYSLGYNAAGTNYNLIGNPYPSAINLKNVASTNAVASYWVYNPRKNYSGNAQVLCGGYDMGTYNNSTDVIIPSMGAFFLQTTAAGTVSFTEASKSTATALTLFGTDQQEQTLALAIENGQGYTWDDVKIRLDDNATNNSKDKYDGSKLSNQLFDFYSLSADGERLGIDSRSNKLTTTIIPLGIKTIVPDNYTFKITNNSLPENSTIILKDKLLHTETLLGKDFSGYTFSITNDTATKGNNRFELVILGKTSLTNIAADQAVATTKISMSPNPFKNVLTVYLGINIPATTIRVMNVLGQMVQSKTVAAGTITTQLSLAKEAVGTYIVEVINEKNTVSQQVVKQ